MPNEMDVRKIIARLAEDRETELTQYELNTLLEQELSKAESEIDTALVEEILKTLEESPSAQEKSTAWQAIESKTQRKKGWMNLTTARRIVACLLVLITISALSVGSAYAFNWTFLLKLLKPLAESFGIYSANTPGQTESVQTDVLYDDEDTGYEQVFYDSIEKMPVEWNDFRVLPAWMPERFTFIQGSMYEDNSTAIFSATYMGEDDFFSLTTNFFYDDENVSAYEYQKTVTEPVLEIIANQEVTYYLNCDTKLLSASWIDQNVHYSIYGDITEEELRNIILGIAES